MIKSHDVGPLWIAHTPGYAHTHGMIYVDNAGHYFEFANLDRDGVLWVNPITA